MKTIRIATWNFKQYADNTPVAEARRAIMAAVHADIWVLTEVHHTFGIVELPDKEGTQHLYKKISWSEPLSRFFPGEMVSIWAREDLQGKTAGIKSTEFTACAEFPVAGSKTLWVYGTVLPWVGSAKYLDGYTFDQALADQKVDWGGLKWVDHGWLCVAGDFNQEICPPKHFYGSGAQEKYLRTALEQADLECLTGGQADPVAKNYAPAANIDHICMGSAKNKTWQVTDVQSWPRTSGGMEISDHHCVSIDVEFQG